jgi:hypothetical protein
VFRITSSGLDCGKVSHVQPAANQTILNNILLDIAYSKMNVINMMFCRKSPRQLNANNSFASNVLFGIGLDKPSTVGLKQSV